MVTALLRWIADRPIAALPLFVLAAAERLAWVLAGNTATLDTELRNTAISWAQTGWIADAFRSGSGPTAHVGALPPVIPGTIFRIFGTDSFASTIVLTTIGAAIVVATALVLSRVFARLGTPAAMRGAAVVLICLIPLHLELEARSLRIYENGYAALLLALALFAMVRLDAAAKIGMRDLVGLSALTVLIVALSPTVGVAAIVMLGILAVRRLDWRKRFAATAVLGLALIATSLPWALRNQAVMGETVWTRGNFGMELALGTHAAAVQPADPAETYLARIREIHPHGNDAVYAAMRAAGGELAYARSLGERTGHWIAAHPADAATIWLRHAREFYFPPLWLWHHTARPDATMPIRMLIVSLIAALALGGLFDALWRRQWDYLYFIPPVLLLPLPYLLTQPLIRYRYVIASLLIFLAADCVARLAAARALRSANLTR